MSQNDIAILILIASFLIMIALRFPIAYAVGLSSVFCLVYLDKGLAIVCQQMVKGISSYSLMAVPFFITMGVLMGSGGISDKLVALANACVGWMRGGLGAVNVLDSFFFGGSPIALRELGQAREATHGDRCHNPNTNANWVARHYLHARPRH